MKTYRLNIGLIRALLFLGILFSVMGCGKSKDPIGEDDTYYFRAKINGKAVNFAHTALFDGGGNDDRWELIYISGYISPYDSSKPKEQDPHVIGFDFQNEGGTFRQGTYTQKGGAGNGLDDSRPDSYSIDMEYLIQTTNGTVQYDTGDLEDLTIQILELSKTGGIKGTFKGTLTHMRNPSDRMVVTEGEFYLPYKKLVNPYK